MTDDADQVAYFRQNLPTLTADLQKQTVTGTAKLAQVVMSGNFSVVSVTLDPTVVDPTVKSGVEQALVEAFADARKLAMQLAAQRLTPPPQPSPPTGKP